MLGDADDGNEQNCMETGFCMNLHCDGGLGETQPLVDFQAGTAATTAADRAAADSRAAAARSLARGVYTALLPPLGAWLGAVAAAKGATAAKGSAAATGAMAESDLAAAGGTAASAPAGRAADGAATAGPPAAAAESSTEDDVRLACRVVAAALLGAQAAGDCCSQARPLVTSQSLKAIVHQGTTLRCGLSTAVVPATS